jgi:hypothetical protein
MGVLIGGISKKEDLFLRKEGDEPGIRSPFDGSRYGGK